MYLVVCFVLLVSLEGLKTNDIRTNTSGTTNRTFASIDLNTNVSGIGSSASHTQTPPKPTSTKLYHATSNTNAVYENKNNERTFLLVFNSKEIMLWVITALLITVCLLLLIIMCLVCRYCRRGRKDHMEVMRSVDPDRRNSVNGGPSETDIMLKNYNSVKVETETTPHEPQGKGGADAEVENQVFGEENKNSADDASEAAPAQEPEKSTKIEFNMEDMEKAE